MLPVARLTVQLPVETHNQIKMISTFKNMSVRNYVEQVFESIIPLEMNKMKNFIDQKAGVIVKNNDTASI